jgi:BMFP domain-containing protein YqiC
LCTNTDHVYLQAGESKVSELQQRLLSLEQSSARHSATAAALTAGDLVSREQVQVMESLFMETIDKLSLRVGQLERSSSGGDLGTGRGLQEGLGGRGGSASNVARLRGFR